MAESALWFGWARRSDHSFEKNAARRRVEQRADGGQILARKSFVQKSHVTRLRVAARPRQSGSALLSKLFWKGTLVVTTHHGAGTIQSME